ncbi:MAG: proton-conducting transporter membrane subunit [Alphaproteobacteria bacterium]
MIALLPEIILVIAILNLFILKNKFSDLESSKVFNITLSYLLVSFLCAITLYNNNIKTDFLTQTSRLFFIKTAVYIYSLIILNLASRWFANKNENGLRFTIIALIQVLCILLLISSHNLIIIASLLSALGFSNCFLLSLRKHYDAHDSKSYQVTVSVLLLMLWTGTFIINSHPEIAIFLILPIIFYLLGLAPFHIGVVNLVSNSILPVSCLLATINIFGYIVLLNFLITNVFQNQEAVKLILQIFGILSMFVGAAYATSQLNLRKLFSYSSVFHIGVMMLVLSQFTEDANISVFVYLLIYSIALLGVYTSFYGLKLNGDYQKDITKLHGIAHYNPFIITSLMVFLISLVGYPPIIGFGGRISVINSLIANHQYLFVGLFIVALMILVYAYLNVIKAFYFAPAVNKKYDRVDFGVYVILFVNIVFVITTLINPSLFTQYLQEVFNKL